VAARASEVQIGTRTLKLSNADKILFPDTGFTKGQLVDYYARAAEVMVPHLRARPITLRRWPDGVEGESFFQKHCPRHRPDWMGAVEMGGVNYCLIEEPAALVWAANLASIEIHPGLATAPALDVPTSVVFDLDPGPPADILTCARVAFLLRECFDRLGLEAWPKTSGSKGLQIYIPLNREATYDQTRDFALALAQLLENDQPDLVLSAMERAKRGGKVFIDWSQNAPSKTTVSVYSLRARPQPSVSTPVTWAELEAALEAGDATALQFSPEQVLKRLEDQGDLHRAVLETRQQLPAIKT
jgi:bifunctional non-homologous end joining protein LigD